MALMPSVITPGETEYRNTIDPHGTLPEVAFTRRGYDTFANGTAIGLFDIQAEGSAVGIANITLSPSPEGTTVGCFSNVWRNPEAPKGTGLATYLLAAELCADNRGVFRSGNPTSAYAKTMWENLISMGVARLVAPFDLIMMPQKKRQLPKNEWLPVPQYRGWANFLPVESLK